MTTIIEKETEQVVEPDHEQSEGLVVEDEAEVLETTDEDGNPIPESDGEESDEDADGTSKSAKDGRFFHVTRHYKFDSAPQNAQAGISEADWKKGIVALIQKEQSRQSVEFCVYIFHDKDVDDDGNAVQVHVHILIRYKDTVPVSDVRKAFQTTADRNGRAVSNNLGASQYLIHISPSALEAEKTMYNISDVVCHNIDYRQMLKASFWKKKVEKDLTAKAKATKVGDIPLLVVHSAKEAEMLASYYSLMVMTGQMQPGHAKREFIRSAGYHWFTKMRVKFDHDLNERIEQTVEHMTHSGRTLRNVYIFGAGGIGKTTLATKLGQRLSKGGGLALTAPLGKDKTPDALNDYKGERAIVFNEMSALGWTLDEYLACFDLTTLAAFPSRNKNKHFIGDTCLFTNSISPMKFANDLLIYSKGGSEYQDPASPKQLDKSNKDALDKYWQIRRRMTNIIALQRDDADTAMVKAHVFNLRYGRYDNEDGTPNMDDGDHIYVGTVTFRAAPGEAPVFTPDAISEIVRLLEISLRGVYASDEVTIDSYLEKVGMVTSIEDSVIADFIENVVSNCKWDLLPTTFLYDLYRRFHFKYYPKDALLNIREFTVVVASMLDGWEYKNTAIRVSDRMDADEPLITEYDLRDWMNQNYQGNDPAKRRAFTRKDRYRGFVRK